ncbi:MULTISPECIES: ABC transporter substrate-binding protein [Spirulina sp. CCY15215]|uniref:ABC transporter substrate-binding protein n=1 Tax=Spirulina sp. CCY15215 TaxID=2767591 RepID=UPI001EF3A4E1|nr:ABC transporter substrate-binding protein [Spirulina major]
MRLLTVRSPLLALKLESSQKNLLIFNFTIAMSQGNETKILIFSLAITGAIIGGGGWWAYNSGLIGAGGDKTPIAATNGGEGLQTRLSNGDRLLVSDTTTPQKQAGIQALSAKNYSEAITNFEASLKTIQNDPETVIYLNNAKIGNAQSYTLAVSVPIGGNIDAAKEMLRGVAQAQQSVNDLGGINGIPLKILIADDDNSPEIAREIAGEFANNRDILGVVGHFGSDTTQAAAQVYQEKGLPMISPTSTSVELSGVGDYIFRSVPSDRFTGSAIARYQLDTLQKQKAAIFYNPQSNYSQSLKEVVNTDLLSQGGEVVAEFDLTGNFNANNAVTEAKNKGAEVLILLSNSETLDAALQVVRVNGRSLPLLAGDSAYTAKTLQIGGQNAEGMVLAIPWHILAAPNTPFAKMAGQLWGGEVNWRTAMSYDALQAFIAALNQNPTRQGVQQALSDRNFLGEGASQKIRFLPSGDRNQAVQLVIIEPGNRTSFGYEFVPIQ